MFSSQYNTQAVGPLGYLNAAHYSVPYAGTVCQCDLPVLCQPPRKHLAHVMGPP